MNTQQINMRLSDKDLERLAEAKQLYAQFLNVPIESVKTSQFFRYLIYNANIIFECK